MKLKIFAIICEEIKKRHLKKQLDFFSIYLKQISSMGYTQTSFNLS